MRAVSLILSLYVFILTLLPCVDSHAEKTFEQAMLTQQDKNAHPCDFDLCSPFCTCNCCHVSTLVTNTTVINSAIRVPMLMICVVKTVQVQEIPLTIWQPPKI